VGRPALNVLVVDDSAVVRQVATAVLSRERDFNVTAAADPLIALDKMRKSRPDVILLDLEMPRMDGLTFLQKLMASDPVPVVVCSGLTGEGSETAMQALEAGAVAVVTKPKLGVRDFLQDSAILLTDTVRGAARARVRRRGRLVPSPPPPPRLSADAVLPLKKRAHPGLVGRMVAVGASTGGTEALRTLLEPLPADAPGIVVVQHMPELFTAAFARRLDQTCRVEVKEARSGDAVQDGRVLIAPGNRHTIVRRAQGRLVVEVTDGPLVSRHRPSVDVLFRSVAGAAGANALGVILTGMGDDGAAGLLEMKQAGAITLAQDEASCVVFGMPKEALARGAVDRVAALDRIAGELLTWSRRPLAVR
jgi:two-component system, chemotaxis family, protein-glutamate methylesterase/glutaminase